MKLDIYNIEGAKLPEQIELSDDVFGIEPNEHCIYLAVKSELAAMRQGTHASKSRSDVSGSGKKPWRQKGTGRARIGSMRNPARVHGGTAFGPEPRDYHQKINRKVKHLARKSVLSKKISEDAVIVLDELRITEARTKEFLKVMANLELSGKKVTFLVADISDELWLSGRNVKNISIVPAAAASAYDLIDCQVLVVDKAGIEQLNTQLAS